MTIEARPWFLVQRFDVTIGAGGQQLVIDAVQSLSGRLFVLTAGAWHRIDDPTTSVPVLSPSLSEAYATVLSLFPETEIIL